jgi:aminobenzoyl-glutamate utilization protein B
MRVRASWLVGLLVLFTLAAAGPEAQRRGGAVPTTPFVPPKLDPRVVQLKETAAADVQAMAGLGQEMVDMVFSFGELGFQEFETQKYLTGILEQSGFKVERGVAGIPSAWVARWGSGRRRRSRAWPITIRSSRARRATARATIPARR